MLWDNQTDLRVNIQTKVIFKEPIYEFSCTWKSEESGYYPFTGFVASILSKTQKRPRNIFMGASLTKM